MFDIGFSELVLVAVIGLLVLGPERLPGAIRTGSLWLGRLRRSFNNIRAEIEREINADEIRQDLHNEGIMESLKQAEQDLRSGLEAADESASIGTLTDDKSTNSDTDKP
jgi:sec-independent protein translocase protein TatB